MLIQFPRRDERKVLMVPQLLALSEAGGCFWRATANFVFQLKEGIWGFHSIPTMEKPVGNH